MENRKKYILTGYLYLSVEVIAFSEEEMCDLIHEMRVIIEKEKVKFNKKSEDENQVGVYQLTVDQEVDSWKLICTEDFKNS